MSGRRQLRSRLVLLLLVLLLGGCVKALAPPRQPLSPEAQRLIELLVARWRDFADLRTLADIHVDQGGDRQQLVGVLLARTPDSVRFEALSPFGQPLLIVSIHEGRLTAYNAGTNEALTGAATADAAARLLSLPFEPQDLVGVLAGRVPPPGDLRVAEILAPDEQGPSVDLIGALHRKRIWMNFETGVIRQVEIVGGRYEARVTYRLDGADRPSGFDLAAAQSYLTATVRYREPVFGAGIEGDRFRFTIPESAKIQQLR